MTIRTIAPLAGNHFTSQFIYGLLCGSRLRLRFIFCFVCNTKIVTNAMRNCFANFGSMLDDPLCRFSIVMEFTFNISGGCCRNADLIELSINLNVLAGTGSKRSYNGKNRLTGFHTLAITAVTKHAGASYLAIKCVGVNGDMQIGTKSIRLSALLLHGLHMTELHFKTTTNKRHPASFGNLSALLSLSSITICVSIVGLIRRGQINFIRHLLFLLISH